jgi:hypothetical protein
MSKKGGIELSISTIIVLILIILVLVLMIMIATGALGTFGKTIMDQLKSALGLFNVTASGK